MVSTLIDMKGRRYGRLVVLCRAGTIHNQAAWLCKCDCGNEKIIRGSCLRDGLSKSCGCLASELARDRLRTHGETKTRLFKIWSMMLERCYRQYNKNYSAYGGRGIKVCDDWKNDFSAFREWAFSNGYRKDLTIVHRI